MFGLRNVLLRSNALATPLRRSIHATPTILNANTADDVYSKLNDGERGIYDKLKAKFGSKTLDVVDVSGMSGFFSFINRYSFVKNELTMSPLHVRRMRLFLRHSHLITAI
jgi:hypothetical protein